jgi:hypothetical protein
MSWGFVAIPVAFALGVAFSSWVWWGAYTKPKDKF